MIYSPVLIEVNGRINLLDITISISQNSIYTSLYGNPTVTDCKIPHDSSHPKRQKYLGSDI